MVKCSYYDFRRLLYIVDSARSYIYSSYIRDYKRYDVILLTVLDVIYLIGDIRKAEIKRKQAKAALDRKAEAFRRQTDSFFKAKSYLNHTKQSKALLKECRYKLAYCGLASLEAEGWIPKAVSLHESRARVANDSRESQERVARLSA